MKTKYSEELTRVWNKEAESYKAESDLSPDYSAFNEELLAVIGNPKGKTICDVGSGTGITDAYLASSGAKLHLVDISPKAITFQKKYFKAKGLQARFYIEDAYKMKFTKESFDVVWNGGVIEHFSDDNKILMLLKMWQLVKPGGILVIAVPNFLDIPFMIAKKILQLRKKWAFGFEDDLTADRMRRLAEKAGIKKYSIYAYNPVVGWWFFPYGKEITNLLGLNTIDKHRVKSPFGHILMFKAQK